MQRRREDPSRGEEGSVLMIALFIMIILSLLGTTLLSLSSTEYGIAYNTVWSEGAFDAAEAGLQTGVSQLSADQGASTPAIPVTNLGGGIFTYQFRSGTVADGGPTDSTFVNTRYEGGYSLAVGTGYNCSGYGFLSYRINATGTGPRNSQRQLQTLAEYGPICK
jgi:Tfp pilus assembly protein PilX